MSLFKPDRQKVEAIVHAIDKDHNGVVAVQEVKLLFSKLFDIPLHSIPDDHEEVLAFAGLSTKEMIEQLCMNIGKDEVDEYYDHLFGPQGTMVSSPETKEVTESTELFEKNASKFLAEPLRV